MDQEYKEQLRVRLYEAYLAEGMYADRQSSFLSILFSKKLLVSTSVVLGTFILVQISGLDVFQLFGSGESAVGGVLAAEPEYVEGEVEILKSGEKTWRVLSDSLSLGSGDRLRTGEKSLLALVFNDGSIIRMAPSSEIYIDTLASYNVSIEQIDGLLYAHIADVSDYEYKIKAGETITAYMGSIFLTEVNSKTGTSKIICFRRRGEIEDYQLTLEEGQVLQVDPDTNESKIFDYIRSDTVAEEFLQWNITMDDKHGLMMDQLVDHSPPRITFLYPSQSQPMMHDTIPLAFTVEDESGVKWVRVNNELVSANNDGIFTTNVSLEQGENEIEIVAKDNAWNVTNHELMIVKSE